MLRPFVADLHVHTVLSPCASYQMVPRLIVSHAYESGLDILAVTDHNSCENVRAMVAAARGTHLKVLPGLEVETREEVHVLALFDHVDQAVGFQQQVYTHLPDLPNEERTYGVQLVVDEMDRLVGRLERLLLTATDLAFEEVIALVLEHGGFCIPAHVDRPAFSVLGALGFLPTGVEISAVEVTRHSDVGYLVARHPCLSGKALLRSSDAHELDDIGRSSTTFFLREPSVAEIAAACRGHAGRHVVQ